MSAPTGATSASEVRAEKDVRAIGKKKTKVANNFSATLSRQRKAFGTTWGSLKKSVSAKSVFKFAFEELEEEDDDDFTTIIKHKQLAKREQDRLKAEANAPPATDELQPKPRVKSIKLKSTRSVKSLRLKSPRKKSQKGRPSSKKNSKRKEKSISNSITTSNVEYKGDKVIDKNNMKIEERMRLVMKAKARRRNEIFEETLEESGSNQNLISSSNLQIIEERDSRGSIGSVRTQKTAYTQRTFKRRERNPSKYRFKGIGRTLKNRASAKRATSLKSLRRDSEQERFKKLDIPQFPKSALDRKLISSSLKKNIFFTNLTEVECDMILNSMQMKEVPKDEVLIQQGDRSDEFYVVKSGMFKFTKVEEAQADFFDIDEEHTPEEIELSRCSSGASFGELALMHNGARMASVTAVEDSSVFVLPRLIYRKIVAFSEHDRFNQIRHALKSVPLLQSLSKQQIADIADCVQLVRFQKDDPIIVKGDYGDIFYFVMSGSVQCTKLGDDESTEVSDVILGTNSYFGERALLVNEPRAANVIARESVECLALNREDFSQHLGSLKALMDQNLSFKVLKAMPFLHDVSDSKLTKLSKLVEVETFSPGVQIIEQGSRNKYLYIITEGVVEVVVYDSSDRLKHTKVTELKAGSYFGESAYKQNAVANAEITAISVVTCQKIDVRKHMKLLKPLAQTMKKNHALRTIDALQAVKNNSLLLNKEELTIEFDDLEQLSTLGTGSFGRVKLVRNKRNGDAFALKILQKAFVVKHKQQKNVMHEKNVMMKAQHPFILRLHKTFVTKNCLHFLLEYVQGGELFSLLHNNGGSIERDSARFYAACVIDAIGYLHKRQIVYRDLKPENLMIDSSGFIRLVDFGFAKKVTSKTYTLCGTPEYLPPETISHRGHNRAADYWAIGILIYEMIAGFSPFSHHEPEHNTQDQIFERILTAKYAFPDDFGGGPRRLVRKMLRKNPMERVGMFKAGPDEIKQQEWFQGFNWEELLSKKMKAPWVPDIAEATDTRHFDEFAEDDSEITYRGSNKYWAGF